VIVSATFSRDGWFPEIVAGMTKMGPDSARAMTQTLLSALRHVAPDPKTGRFTCQTRRNVQARLDWSKDVPAIKAPYPALFGDADASAPRIRTVLESWAEAKKTAAGRIRISNARLADFTRPDAITTIFSSPVWLPCDAVPRCPYAGSQ